MPLAVDDALLLAAFVAVPLAVSPALGDGFTDVKWYLVELLAVAWLAVQAVTGRSLTRPAFARRHAAALIALAALTVASTLRSGPGWAVEPLLARAAFAVLALGAASGFARTGCRTCAVERGLTTALAIVVTVGLAQLLGLTRALGWEPLLGLAGGDGRGATFGNANMAAQFAGFAVTFLAAVRASRVTPTRGRGAVAGDVLAAAALGYMFLAGSRSAMVATAVAWAAIAAVAGRRAFRPLLRPVVLAALIALPLAAVAFASGRPARATLVGSLDHPLKTQSVRIRAALWRETAALVRDRPLGAGSGNFLHAFLPYQLRDERLRGEDVVYGTPHNELLRALAEEGIVWTALAAYLVFGLAAAVRRRARREAWPAPAVVLAGGAAFLLVESAFQFPFGTAFGSLAAAALLGLAVSYAGAEEGRDPPTSPRSAIFRLGTAGAAIVGAVALGGLVGSDFLTGASALDPGRLRLACELNARNLRACLTSAWVEARAGNAAEGRARAAAVLERSPYYFPAIKLLADESLAQGDVRAGCFHLWVYDALFAGASSQHGRLDALCEPALLEGFGRHVAVPGYERFPLRAGAPSAR